MVSVRSNSVHGSQSRIRSIHTHGRLCPTLCVFMGCCSVLARSCCWSFHCSLFLLLLFFLAGAKMDKIQDKKGRRKLPTFNSLPPRFKHRSGELGSTGRHLPSTVPSIAAAKFAQKFPASPHRRGRMTWPTEPSSPLVQYVLPGPYGIC